jgi:hypothetical protein
VRDQNVDTNTSSVMFNQFVRTNLELYNGYEVFMDKRGLLAAFNSCNAALDWCMSTQVGLLRLKWPAELLEIPMYVLAYHTSPLTNLLDQCCGTRGRESRCLAWAACTHGNSCWISYC